MTSPLIGRKSAEAFNALRSPSSPIGQGSLANRVSMAEPSMSLIGTAPRRMGKQHLEGNEPVGGDVSRRRSPDICWQRVRHHAAVLMVVIEQVAELVFQHGEQVHSVLLASLAGHGELAVLKRRCVHEPAPAGGGCAQPRSRSFRTWVGSITCTPDGSKLVVVCDNGYIFLGDSSGKKPREWQLEGPIAAEQGASGACFAPHGRYLVIENSNATAQSGGTDAGLSEFAGSRRGRRC